MNRAGLIDITFCIALAFVTYVVVFDQQWGEQIIRAIAREAGRVHFFH